MSGKMQKNWNIRSRNLNSQYVVTAMEIPAEKLTEQWKGFTTIALARDYFDQRLVHCI
jgi:hypothetical protein